MVFPSAGGFLPLRDRIIARIGTPKPFPQTRIDALNPPM